MKTKKKFSKFMYIPAQPAAAAARELREQITRKIV